MNYTANWNKLDSFIFFCENQISKITASVRDNKDVEPEVELMIQAETEHLKTENESLKKRERPVPLIEEEGEFFCPKCYYKLSDLQVKYCASCGHRVMWDNEKKKDKSDT